MQLQESRGENVSKYEQFATVVADRTKWGLYS